MTDSSDFVLHEVVSDTPLLSVSLSSTQTLFSQSLPRCTQTVNTLCFIRLNVPSNPRDFLGIWKVTLSQSQTFRRVSLPYCLFFIILFRSRYYSFKNFRTKGKQIGGKDQDFLNLQYITYSFFLFVIYKTSDLTVYIEITNSSIRLRNFSLYTVSNTGQKELRLSFTHNDNNKGRRRSIRGFSVFSLWTPSSFLVSLIFTLLGYIVTLKLIPSTYFLTLTEISRLPYKGSSVGRSLYRSQDVGIL